MPTSTVPSATHADLGRRSAGGGHQRGDVVQRLLGWRGELGLPHLLQGKLASSCRWNVSFDVEPGTNPQVFIANNGHLGPR